MMPASSMGLSRLIRLARGSGLSDGPSLSLVLPTTKLLSVICVHFLLGFSMSSGRVRCWLCLTLVLLKLLLHNVLILGRYDGAPSSEKLRYGDSGIIQT